MRIWFNKTFSTIGAVFRNLRQSVPAGEVTLICTHTHLTAAAFLAADESHLEPVELTGQAYVEWCVDFCHQHNINLFWPGKEAALISKYHVLFQAIGVQVLSVADYHTLTLLVSVFGLGFRVLDTQRDSITQLLKGVEYQIPLQELRQGMNNTPEFATLLVMEHLGGPEWSVDCAGRHGELICAVQRKKSPLAGHGQTIDNNVDIQGMVTRLTAYYRLNGLFNIQFKEGVNGPSLLEINPRPSGGFGMACLSGANLAYIALQGIKGSAVQPPVIRYGLRVTEINTPVVLQEL
ncbi:MAG: ATP-grasp domain-containing protein [Methylococcaceae bacterium]|nr:ATP-grasp domain-containing protein [Methylococcaceae bacterium]OYV22124.1 MAG: hypothetical protein CG442_1510 [Methylococcaceae bacterium NSO1]